MHLRKTFLFIQLLFCLPLFAQTATDGHFSLRGKINGDAPKELKLAYEDIAGQWRVDSVRVDQGKFEFKGTVNGPTTAYLIGNITSRSMDDPNRTWFFLEPTSIEIAITVNDFSSIIVRGSRLQDEYQKFNETERPLLLERKRLDAIDKKIQSQKDSKNLQTQKDIFNTQWSKYVNAVNETRLKFIKEHSRSALTAYLLPGFINSDMISPDSAAMIYNEFPKSLKNAKLGKQVDATIKTRHAVLKEVVGNPAPVIDGLDINGKTIRSDAYIDKKYVLLYFWATWCAPCHDGFPLINSLHNKYSKTNLEVIGVSADLANVRYTWKEDIVKSKIGQWKQMLAVDDTNKEKGKLVVNRFYISTYPTTLLIDKSGVVVYRCEGINNEDIKNMDAILHSSAGL
jgi:thiol-disulfide isomerase/thioredoxin